MVHGTWHSMDLIMRAQSVGKSTKFVPLGPLVLSEFHAINQGVNAGLNY
jgi:hypothetical protein